MNYTKYQTVKSSIKILNQNIVATNIAQDDSKLNALIYAEYSRDILNEPIQLLLSVSENLTLKYNYVVPPFHYSDSECQKQ